MQKRCKCLSTTRQGNSVRHLYLWEGCFRSIMRHLEENIFWARKPAGLEQSRPALHDTPHSLSQIVLCTCAFLRYFQRSFVVINFQDWGSFDAATVSTGGLWKVRPWEEEKLEEEEKVEASRSCFFRSSRALRTVRSRGALEAAVAPAIRTFPDQ